MTESSSDTNSAEAKPADAAQADVKPSTESSPAEKSGEKPDTGVKGDMLSAVKAALKPKEESPTSEKTDPKSEQEPEKPADKPGDEDDGEDEFSQEELASLKAKTRRQFEKRNARITELTSEIEATKPKAEQLDRILNFVEEAGLAPGEVNNLFDIGRNLKVNPRKAFEQMKPVYAQLQQMFGEVLPDDLQAEVNRGVITQDHARSLAASRSDAAIAKANADRLERQQTETRQRQATEAQVNTVKQAVTGWETSQAKDPDWSLKQPDVMQAIELALFKRDREGKGLPTPAEAVEIAEQAKAAVNEKFAKLRPARKEIKPVTDTASVPSTARPSSPLEAARMGLAKARAAG